MVVISASRYAIQISRYFLVPIGIYPLSRDSPVSEKLMRLLSIFGSYGFMFFLLICCGLHTFVEETNIAIKIKLIGPLNFVVMTLIIYTTLIVSIGEIGRFYELVEQDWQTYGSKKSEADMALMVKSAKIGRFFALLCFYFTFGGGFFFHVAVPMSANKAIASIVAQQTFILEAENNTEAIAMLPLPRALTWPVYRCWINIDHLLIYGVIFVLQFIAGTVLYTVTVAACSVCAVFIAHIVGQFEIVMARLKKFTQDENASAEENDRQIAEIVELHLRSLDFAARVESSISVICCAKFIGCTMHICFLGYYFITEWNEKNPINTVTQLVLLSSATMHIFIFCYMGEILMTQSAQVSELTYSVKWYGLPSKKAMDLTMIMIISSCHPAKITAGGMVDLRMLSFATVVKSGATYLNLLRTMMI